MKLTIPYYLHKAGAGFPSPATDYIEEDIDLNMHLIRNVPATFIIRVQGKSMVDVGINDGDLLVVDKSLKPKNDLTCDVCGTKLIQREDDSSINTIKKRLQIYHDQTIPVLELFKDKVIKINGEQPLEDVTKDILEKL